MIIYLIRQPIILKLYLYLLNKLPRNRSIEIMKWHYFFLLFSVIIIIIFANNFSNFTIQSTNNIDTATPKAMFVETKRNSKLINHQRNLVRELNLTTEQKKEIQAIRRHYQQQIALRTKTIGFLEKQLTEMIAGNNSASAIRAKHRELMILHQQIGDLRFESMLATREILTIEQRQKFMGIVRATVK